jgi:RNA polymerase sigma-70 factor, ECF subfamily
MDFLTELESCLPSLQRYARSLVRDREAASDLVQDCVERALSRQHLWRSDGSLRPWLFRILHNLHANEVRRYRATPAAEPIDAGSVLMAEEEGQSSRVALREMERALALLSEEQRRIVLLVALSGLSYQDCADTLGVPVGTVMSRLSRGRERLRQLLEDQPATGATPLLRRVK